MQLWHHAPHFHQAWCGPGRCGRRRGRRRGRRFPRSGISTLGRGAGSASRILSAVQYLRVSSAGVSTECLMILAGVGLEKRFHANRYTPTSKQSRTVPTRGRRMNLCCCNIIVLFQKSWYACRALFSSLHFPEATLSQDQAHVSSKG